MKKISAFFLPCLITNLQSNAFSQMRALGRSYLKPHDDNHHHGTPTVATTQRGEPTTTTGGDGHSSVLLRSSRSSEDIFSAIHRKEFEMKGVNAQHVALSDPVRMAIGYGLEGIQPLKLAKALRRVYDDPNGIDNPNRKPTDPAEQEATGGRAEKLLEYGMKDAVMRRGSFIVDIKRKSLSRPGENFARYDDAGMVAEAMISLGADAVFVNVDYHSYGGDITELRSAVQAVKKVSPTAAVVMKDIVVDEIQLGLAKDAGADGILLISSVLGPALPNFLDLATTIGLETIVECHTRNEVQAALDALAQNILVSNYDRVQQRYYPDQAYKLAGMFPGSGGPFSVSNLTVGAV